MRHLFFFFILTIFAACGGEKADTSTTETPKKATENHPAKITQKINSQNPNQKVINVNGGRATTQVTPPKAMSLGDYKAKNEGWMVDMEQAYAKSKQSGKPIMANFTGSDWCGWCKKLDRDVFHKPDFKKWADKNVVLLELDYPRRFRVPSEIAAQNNGLKQAFGIRGYPTIWVFDADKDANGKLQFEAYGKTGYTKTVAEFTSKVDGFISAKGTGE